MRSAAYRPQAGFPVALYEDDPAQTIFLCGISLLALHRRGGLALVVEILACAAASILAVCVHPPCVGAAVFQSAWCRELSSVPALLLWWTPLRFAGHRHVWPAPAAVSSTHLDVYKRQASVLPKHWAMIPFTLLVDITSARETSISSFLYVGMLFPKVIKLFVSVEVKSLFFK